MFIEIFNWFLIVVLYVTHEEKRKRKHKLKFYITEII